MLRQKIVKHGFVAQLTCQRQLQVLGSPLCQQPPNILMTEVARHRVRGAVGAKGPDVDGAAGARIMLRKPLLRYAHANACGVVFHVPPYQIRIAERGGHQNVCPAPAWAWISNADVESPMPFMPSAVMALSSL